MIEPRQLFYLGCYQDKGHYLWAPGMQSRSLQNHPGHRHYEMNGTSEWIPVDSWPDVFRKTLDGGFLPRARREGEALLSTAEGWTVLAFADYSVDQRPGSHSTFVAEGAYTFEEMMTLAKEKFPEVWRRFRFEVRLPEIAR